jgi:hypothetical protein
VRTLFSYPIGNKGVLLRLAFDQSAGAVIFIGAFTTYNSFTQGRGFTGVQKDLEKDFWQIVGIVI